MSFTCIDCHDQTCPQFGTTNAACDDRTTEDQFEDEPQPETPPRILSCDKHADLEARVAVLEDLVSRMVREMNRGRE